MYIKKSRVIVSVIAIVILTAVLTTLILNPFGIDNTDKFLKFSVISRIINSAYYDDIDRAESAEMAIAGVAASTGDPYTQYYWGDTAIEYMEQLQGDYCGVGMYIKCDTEENLITVVSSIAGSPAEEAGITTDDKILKIDGQVYTGEQLNEASDYMRGEEGTDVTLSIRKAKDNSEQELTLTRRKIVIETVASKMLDNGIGYLNISQFTENVSGSVKEHLDNLSNEEMKSLIIDLRNNPGGILNEAVNISSMFIDTDEIVTYTLDKNGKRSEFKSTDYLGAGKKYAMDIVILVNGGSASASEVLTGALKDYGKAYVIGEKTYGKGIVQSVMAVGANNILSVTTSRYYSPNGVCIHGTGIEPDRTIEMSYENMITDINKGIGNDIQLKEAVKYLTK